MGVNAHLQVGAVPHSDRRSAAPEFRLRCPYGTRSNRQNSTQRYTLSMQKSMPSVKTAVSLKRQLFQQVDKIARDQKLPRSQVFVLALEAYVAQYQNRILLDRINDAYSDSPDSREKKRSKAARRTHRRIVEGEW